jgi:hypothetical protein
MRRAARRRLSCLVVLVVFSIATSFATAGLIVPASSTSLKADASSSLKGAQSDEKTATDTGDLADPNVAATANASLPAGESGNATASGNVDADLNDGGDVLTITGSASADVSDVNPFEAQGNSVATIILPFTIGEDSIASLSYDLVIRSMVQNNSKVTINWSRQGATSAIFYKVFNESVKGTLEQQLAPGGYNLIIDAGALATNKGVPGEQGDASFNVTITAAPASTAIPLPAAVYPGLVLLTGIAAKSLRRRAVG